MNDDSAMRRSSCMSIASAGDSCSSDTGASSKGASARAERVVSVSTVMKPARCRSWMPGMSAASIRVKMYSTRSLRHWLIIISSSWRRLSLSAGLPVSRQLRRAHESPVCCDSHAACCQQAMASDSMSGVLSTYGFSRNCERTKSVFWTQVLC